MDVSSSVVFSSYLVPSYSNEVSPASIASSTACLNWKPRSASFAAALNTFLVANDVTYGLEQKGEDYWAIYSSESVATVLTLKGKSTYKQVGNTEVTDEIKEGYEEAVANDENTFEVDGITYTRRLEIVA